MKNIIISVGILSAGFSCYYLFSKKPIISKPVVKPIIKSVVIPKKIVVPKKKTEIKPIPEPVIFLKPRKLTFSDDIIYKDIKDIQIKSPDKNDWELIKENK